MSLAADRELIASCLSTVEGVTGYTGRPTGLQTGTAWPLLRRLDREGVPDLMATWEIVVILPSDPDKASEWFEAKFSLLDDALRDIGYVTGITPAILPTDGGDLDVMQISFRREAL